MVVATGFFDGVHLGHASVLDSLVKCARGRNTRSVAVTFWPHPRNVLQNGARGLRFLSSREEKREKILAAGVDSLEVVEFTRDFSRLDAREYFREYVMGRFGADAIVLGWDNRIGYNSGSVDEVAAIAESLGLDVVRTSPVMVDGEAVSSTRIRKALSEGDVSLAERMLGYRYRIDGVVVEGDRIGRTIGFPTANMQLFDPLKMVPSCGVYLVKVHTLGRVFFGMANVGTRPTVTGVSSTDSNASRLMSVETHIFDFDEEIYGLAIGVEFVSRIRSERRFDSLQALRSQLGEDAGLCMEMIEKLTDSSIK